MATTLFELKELVDRLCSEYGNIPLTSVVLLDEMPGYCHTAFVGTGNETIVEVDASSLPFRV